MLQVILASLPSIYPKLLLGVQSFYCHGKAYRKHAQGLMLFGLPWLVSQELSPNFPPVLRIDGEHNPAVAWPPPSAPSRRQHWFSSREQTLGAALTAAWPLLEQHSLLCGPSHKESQQQVTLLLLYHCNVNYFRIMMATFRKTAFLSNP